MFKLDVLVKLKKDVLDPQGKAIELAAKNINIKNIYSVKQNKYFEIIVEKVPNKKKAEEIVEKLSKNLLANEVIEDYQVIGSKKI
ncbi:MAG: Phosphoribosylformylglycinamidine synthase subunit PurS [Alphaproteobacteria bacterium MarineAlpha9_Bin4]|nr:phosphoribosylformylglycinamidine synthase [Pelagibacterales bacterium]PPR27002.1 MAG: Phosphoribosylformylglycinamidine synthase subunit PurS [Alphaproteobacteria bacterium MarineAlpha9_Bin4]|tara:strand:+ start:3172 stop:3426 length:255 start_codon:yes stop_codon:yes gene_type:complete